MSTLNEIRHRRDAVKQTRQITNAMYLLSTSQLKKSMKKIDYTLLYMHRLRANIKGILQKSQGIKNPYLEFRQNGRSLFVVISSDKGMCGSYNLSVFNCAYTHISEYDNPFVATAGLTATDLFTARGITPDIEWIGASANPSMFYARQIGEALMKIYDEGTVNQVFVVYTRYKSVSTQEAECLRLLPLQLDDFDDVDIEFDYNADMLFEPSAEEVFHQAVSQYVIGMVFDLLNQSSASEHASRMNSMQNSTHSADEMLEKLNLEFNAARQLGITNEITEIAAASEIQAV